jgi:hypothetical protein
MMTKVTPSPSWAAVQRHGQKLDVTGQDPAPAGVIVRSRIIKANGEPVEVDLSDAP